MWEKARQYLHKMGGNILVASIINWFLGYYPRHSAGSDLMTNKSPIEQTTLNDKKKENQITELEHIKAWFCNEFLYRTIGQTIQPIWHR
jgi:ferrous iron transport protein B